VAAAHPLAALSEFGCDGCLRNDRLERGEMAMIKRRGFAGCGLCAALGLVAMGTAAQAPGFVRKEVNRAPAEAGQDVVQIMLTIEPNVNIARHTHPGTETGAVIAGEAVLSVEGQPDRTIKPGDAVFVRRGVPHAVANSDKPFVYVATYVVDRDKPLASPA
jgi:quercetin dioxygenase-like cupin family protein